ncbi:CBF-domain-containing protein [Auriscalpium vulgare]|uniref:CBF-domain-containing protein n=1 Tax=Auriscalpium vulgare TaxID=40419 RepID=A0ACB8S5E1_9AGAM|nr:CBF-domain-containing protein [Auriscalpium vulgare]
MAPSSLPPAAKRRKTATKSSNKSSDDHAKIIALESALTAAVSAKASLNPLADLVELTRTADDPQALSKAIYATYRVFVLIISEGKLEVDTAEGPEDEAKVVRAWILERLADFAEALGGLMSDAETSLRTSALSIQMSLVKHLSSSLSKASTRPQFHSSFFKRVVRALLVCPPSPRAHGELSSARLATDVRDMFVGTWLSVHTDVRWFFLRDAQAVLADFPPATHPHVPDNLLSVLERLTAFPTAPDQLTTWWVDELRTKPKKPASKKGKGRAPADSDSDSAAEDAEDADDWRKFFDEPDASAGAPKSAPAARLARLTVHQSLHALPSHRAVFTRVWLALLPHLGSRELSLRALNVMHASVIPHMTRAVMLNDWVGTCVDYGGAIGLLALNTLFVLMQQYNLDYPSFYTRLYAFLDKDLLHLKYRARFFRLAEIFLSSSHLPATMLASFVKRLARLSLSGPPASIVILIPFTYNILKRHPALMVMIHRDADDASNEDPFLSDEPNPNATHALDSSLWELYTHKSHYHAGVSTLARIFEEAFTKPAYPLEDFLDHTYATLLDAELKRKVKKDPVVAFEAPSGLFTEGEGPVEGLWSFTG